jgi:hypothetical protein
MSILTAWLESQYLAEGRTEPWLYKDKPGVAVLERLAFLVFAKGQGRGVRWGALAYGDGPYGRTGLCQDEALELIYLYGVRDGIVFAEGNEALEEYKRRIKAETQRVAEETGYVGDDDDNEDQRGEH